MSFQTIESVQSADVVGNNRIELILYVPITNHAKLIAMNINLGVVVSTSKLPNILFILKMLVSGVKIAILVVEMEKIFRFFPDIYNIKAFIMTCWPGLVARAIALALRFATSAALFWPEVVVGVIVLRSAAITLE
jgi:hypothetical protein